MRRWLSLAVLVVALLAVALPAAAHTRPPAAPEPATVAPAAVLSVETLVAAAPAPPPPWAVLAVLALGALALAWRPRRGIALVLVLVAGVVAFETGLHSTHHLDRPDEAAKCVILGMTVELSADLVEVPLGSEPVPSLPRALAAFAPHVVSARAVAPDAGRAPPALPA